MKIRHRQFIVSDKQDDAEAEIPNGEWASGALRPKRICAIPIQGFDRSLKLPSAVRQWRTSKSPGGTGSGGGVSSQKSLRRLRSLRTAAGFATESTKGSRCQPRRRFIIRKKAANSRSNKF